MAEIYDYEAGFDDLCNKNAWFERIIGEGKTILEVGCATGYVGEYLVKQRGCRVYGLEYVPAAAVQARERGCYADVVTGDIQDPANLAGLKPGTFDFVLFGDVLEHLMTPEKALENIAPLLTPEGHVLICVPSIVHWSLRWKILCGQFEYTETGPLDRTHVHFFTPQTARSLVRNAGFRIVQEGGVVWLPSAIHKLPPKLRGAVERFFARLWPNWVYGQSLLDIQLA